MNRTWITLRCAVLPGSFAVWRRRKARRKYPPRESHGAYSRIYARTCARTRVERTCTFRHNNLCRREREWRSKFKYTRVRLERGRCKHRERFGLPATNVICGQTFSHFFLSLSPSLHPVQSSPHSPFFRVRATNCSLYE